MTGPTEQAPVPAPAPAPATQTESDAAAAAKAPAGGDDAAPPPPAAVPHWTDADYEAGLDLQEDGEADGDSALGSLGEGSTDSITASIMEYRNIHGRTFHAQRQGEEYWGPNDERQNESMDMSHHVYTMVLDDALHLAPLPDKLAKVLDLGTGSGIWAIDFADMHPEAEVVGVDLSPALPSWTPPNCSFQVDDVTLPWTFRPDSFDYIHARALIGSISDWGTLFQEAFAAAKPGGWVESFEITVDFKTDDGSVVPGMAMYEWGPLFHEVGRKMGKSLEVVESGLVRDAFREAGFANISTKRVKVPVTGWPQDAKQRAIGQFNHLAIEEGLEGYSMYMLTQIMGWPPEQVQLMLSRVRKEFRKRSVHAYMQIEVVYGQKPEAASA